MKTTKAPPAVLANDAKKVFRKLGTCSRTMFFLMNREFDASLEKEERAADPLAGGILKQGYQCGMLWGASLAVGAEAYRSCEHLSQAIAVSVEATKLLMTSFEKQEHTTQCREITRCDFQSTSSFAKYLLSGRFLHCYQLAESWAPEAVKTARKAFKAKPHNFEYAMSCASEVAKRMGASEEEMTMVAGFAGGLGLSGNGCGALSACLWMNALNWCRQHDVTSPSEDPKTREILRSFNSLTDGKILCQHISQVQFDTLKDHTTYLQQGGCRELIDVMSEI